ncbi:MAG: LysE family translocator [Streptosporangiales bacterium]|nr:LysE family translocator [Streptosporangiales bacterium]
MDAHLVIGFVLAAALLSIVPGQDMLFIISNAVVGGRRTAVLCAVGVSTGIAVHTVAAAFGLSALIAAAPAALDVIRWAGAAVLVYFAVSTWLASRRHLAAVTDDQPVPPPRSAARTYAMAVLTNVANPKVIIFYLAFVPQFVTTGASSWPVATQFLALGGLLIVVGLTVDSTVGLLAGTAAELIRKHRRVRCWLDRVSAAVFGALAARLVADSS